MPSAFDGDFTVGDFFDPLGIGRGLFGGSKSKPKSATEALMEQLAARGAGLGTYFGQQKEFAPKFLGLDLDLTKQFAPEFAKVQKDVQRAVNPERALALEMLGELLSTRGNLASLNISPEIQRSVQQDVRSGQAARGQLLSPISSLTEAEATLAQRISERDKFINLANVLGGGLGVIQPQQFSNENIVPNLTPLQSLANQTAFQRFATEEQSRNQRMQGLGNVLGTAGTLALLAGSGGAAAPALIGSGLAGSFGNTGSIGNGIGSSSMTNRINSLFPGRV